MLRHAFAALALLSLTACASQMAVTGVDVHQGRHGETIVTPILGKAPPPPPKSFALIRGKAGRQVVGELVHAGVGLGDAQAAAFAWDGDVLVHKPSGVRLPKLHDGCRLAAIAAYTPPGDSVPLGYDHGLRAEYDCAPATDLTYVDVLVQTASPMIANEPKGVQMGAAQVASHIVRVEAEVPGTPCSLMDLKTEPGHVNRDLDAAQCGVKWGRRSEPKQLYGSAAYVLARGAAYVGFLNSCIDPACATNRPKFGHFLDTFDLTSLKG